MSIANVRSPALLRAVAIILFCAALMWPMRTRSNASFAPALAAASEGSTTFVLTGDALDDLARLLRPMQLAVALPAGERVLHLRDAVYAGATSGSALALSLWLSEPSDDETSLLGHDDTARPLTEVVQRLRHGPLSGRSFVLVRLAVSWQAWTLTIRRDGNQFAISNSSDTALLSGLGTAPALIASTDTRAVSVPIGFGLVKATAWIPWFLGDRIVLDVFNTPPATPPVSPPDLAVLSGQPGAIVGQGFLNDIFANELRSRVFTNSTNGKNYRISNVAFSANPGALAVSGSLLDVPPPATVRLTSTMTGDDLMATSITGVVDCGTPPLPVRDCIQLQGEVNIGTIGFTLRLTTNPQRVRPDDVQNLGNFFVGTKPLHGVARINRVHSAAGAAVLDINFRLRGGHLQ